MACYQSYTWAVVGQDEWGDVWGEVATGCHQDYVDTVSEAVTLAGELNIANAQCVTSGYEEDQTFRFFCVDEYNGWMEGYAVYQSAVSPGPAYTGSNVAFIKGGSNEFSSLPDYPQQKGSDMQCVTIGEGGALVLQNPQPANLSECGMVVLSGSEAIGNPFALSAEAGATISVAIIGVWAVAFAFRALIQTLSVKGSNHEEVSA